MVYAQGYKLAGPQVIFMCCMCIKRWPRHSQWISWLSDVLVKLFGSHSGHRSHKMTDYRHYMRTIRRSFSSRIQRTSGWPLYTVEDRKQRLNFAFSDRCRCETSQRMTKQQQSTDGWGWHWSYHKRTLRSHQPWTDKSTAIIVVMDSCISSKTVHHRARAFSRQTSTVDWSIYTCMTWTCQCHYKMHAIAFETAASVGLYVTTSCEDVGGSAPCSRLDASQGDSKLWSYSYSSALCDRCISLSSDLNRCVFVD